MTLADLCIFAALLVAYACVGAAKAGGFRDYDNAKPRDPAFYASGWRARALGAHQNGLEGFAFFALAVVFAEFRGVHQSTVDALALAFVIVRLAYIAAYIGNRALIRSTVWTLGFLINVALFFSAWRWR
jgi:uncharacterized MAPEG superfamily protein